MLLHINLDLMDQIVWPAIGSVITVLLAANGYFVARLVKKLDEASATSVKTSGEVAELKIDIKHLNEEVAKLTDVYQRLVTLEKQVAIFEFIIRQNPRNGHDTSS